MTFRYCQLYVLGGCYGRVVRTQSLFEQKQLHIEQLKTGLSHSQRLIEQQLQACDQFTSRSAEEPALVKKLSLVSEEDLSQDHGLIIGAV